MENDSLAARDMVRRKTLLHIRKYLIIFFGLLLVFIFINHGANRDITNKMVNHRSRNGNSRIKSHGNRTQHLHELAKRENIINKVRDKERDRIAGNFAVHLNFSDTDVSDHLFGIKKHRIHNSIKPARYFVNSPKCKMPYADPFSRDALDIYNPSKLKSCTNESDLFWLEYSMQMQQYKLRVNEELVRNLAPDIKKVGCKYREIVRGTNSSADFYSELKERISFQKDKLLDRNITGIIVECHDLKNPSHIIQQDAFPIIQLLNRTKNEERNRRQRQPSVIMLGLDSMSRMNFQRTMPQTSSWLLQPGWYEMEGYNKVGDNTLPNLLPVLCGRSQGQVEKICELHERGCLDSLPWIWKDFKSAGYRTALAEDILDHAMFNLGLPGFVSKPVDHYLRPFLLGISQALNAYKRFGYRYCIGRRLSIGYVYEFCRQFTERYIENLDEPVFGLFWSYTFTHDYYFGAASLDTKLVEYFKILDGHQLFEKSIVILFSDHGARFGDLMELPDSFLEERLPILHIYLPPWFRSTYPKYSQALHLNRNRLSSNYDLHNTLRHILQLNADTREDLPPLDNCRTSQSLFHPLPRDRSCIDACINEHWCTCNEYITQPLNTHMYQMAKRLLFHINYWMLEKRFNLRCQRLLLADIDHVERKMLYEDMGKESMYGAISIYRMRFHTFPPEGKYQATLRFNRDLQDFDKLDVADISRLNAYHNDSSCVANKIAKKFCFCYPDKMVNEMNEWRDLRISNKKKTSPYM